MNSIEKAERSKDYRDRVVICKKEDKYYIALDDYAHDIVRSLNDTKTELQKEGKFTSDVTDLIVSRNCPQEKVQSNRKDMNDESR